MRRQTDYYNITELRVVTDAGTADKRNDYRLETARNGRYTSWSFATTPLVTQNNEI